MHLTIASNRIFTVYANILSRNKFIYLFTRHLKYTHIQMTNDEENTGLATFKGPSEIEFIEANDQKNWEVCGS